MAPYGDPKPYSARVSMAKIGERALGRRGHGLELKGVAPGGSGTFGSLLGHQIADPPWPK